MTALLLTLLLACDPSTPAASPVPQGTEAPVTAPAKSPSLTAPASRDVHVTKAWIRHMPPGSTTTAAFMKLHNGGTAATAIVSASSDVADAVELHTHVMEDGVAKMRQVDQFALAVDQSHALEPAGDHIMLIGLHQDLALDQSVALDLRFADGSEQQVQAIVSKQPMPASPQEGSDAHAHSAP